MMLLSTETVVLFVPLRNAQVFQVLFTLINIHLLILTAAILLGME